MVMLYHRDAVTHDHVVTHDGKSERFATRSAALRAAREMMRKRRARPTTD